MIVLAIADRPPQTNLLNLISENNVELVCTLGDLDYSSLQELERVKDIPKIGVYGNHCSGTYFEPLGIKNMHLKTFEYKGIVFGGFEGSIRYKSSTYGKMYTQEEAKEMLKNFPYVDVMLAHSPPYGINDEPESISHQGFIALREYLEKKEPRYFFHGHTYPTEDNMVREYHKTKIIYVYRTKIIKIE